MPFDGSGSFSLIHNWIDDQDANIEIMADRMLQQQQDIANGLSACVTRAGLGAMVGNLPMGGKRITALGAPVMGDDAATKDYVDAGDVAAKAYADGLVIGLRNLLINGDFVINQRGFAGGALTAGTYGYDRWRAAVGGANYSVAGDEITLTSGALMQVVESPRLAGEIVTLSLEDLSADIGIDIEGETGTITAGSGRRGVTLTVPAGSTGDITVKLSASGAAFKRAQLNVGSVATPFERRLAGVEEWLCRRYYFRADNPTDLNSLRYAGSASSVWQAGLIPFPRVMRIAPAAAIVVAPTYVNCSNITFATGGRDASARVTTAGVASYRAYGGTYEFDAEFY